MAVFTRIGQGITKAPAVFALVMPIASIIVVIFGMQDLKVETSVSKLWVPESTPYAADSQYEVSATGGSSSSNVLAISRARQSGNILKANLLLELRDRLNDTQHAKVVVDGMTFSFHDACYNPAGAYDYPCFRMHVLDCFAEGGYDFGEVAAGNWRAQVQAQAMQSGLALNQALKMLYEPVVKTGLLQGAPCNATCTFDGHSAIIAQALQAPAGTWETAPACASCLAAVMAQAKETAVGQATLDAVYVQVLEMLIAQISGSTELTGAALKAMYRTSTEKEAVNEFLKAFPPLVQMANASVQNTLAGKTPYSFQTDPSKFGQSRPHLRDPDSGILASDTEVLAAASGACYAWDGGAVMPRNLNVLLYGEPSPMDFSANKSLESVQALQHLYRFVKPKDLRDRVATRSAAHGGPLSITLDQATTVLETYKAAFEQALSFDWNVDSSGSLEHTAFTDDVGASGTFARTLKDLTTDSLPLIAIYGGVTVLLSALFFVSTNCVASRVMLGVFGSMLAILGCFAALALSALCGINLNVVHFWTMPFIIIGIGIDDMFMLALSSETVAGGSGAETFAKAFANVAVPVTMTSLLNGAMFAIMYFTSDIRAVYQAGNTGMMATGIVYLTMVLSFSAFVYLDSQRRASSRYECLPCKKAPASEESHKSLVGNAIYDKVYKPLITTYVGRFAILAVFLGTVVSAAVGLQDLPVGLDLQDFFPVGTSEGKFALERNKYFPVWPVTLNWGQLKYTDADVQLKMAHQWEKLVDSSSIGLLPTSLVWTVALANWGLDAQDASCMPLMVENKLGLKLQTQGGFCLAQGNSSKCPVLAGLNASQFAQCIAKWRRSSREYDVLAPQITFKSDETTIHYSSASGSALFAINLRSTNDYTNMIKETRRHVDDDASLHSWMSGVPFGYWEQYLSIEQVMMLIGGLSILAGFVVSVGFVFSELSFSRQGTCLKRLYVSLLGGLLIAVVSAVSLLTVVGFCGLAKIQLSGFTAMSCVMSTGLAVEYSVHVVHRFIEAPAGGASARIDHAMAWLFSPSAMAFVTSAVSVLMMAFSEFRFVRLYFFAPLACAVIASYFFGAVALPSFMGSFECIPAMSAETPSDEEESNDRPAKEEPTTPLGNEKVTV